MASFRLRSPIFRLFIVTLISAVIMVLNFIFNMVSDPCFMKKQCGKGVSLLPFLNAESYNSFHFSKKRPVIFSFYRAVDFRQALKQNPSLLAWAEMWASTGFDPVLLTINDSRHHDDFSKHVSEGMGISHEIRYTRYLAMSTIRGGGWFSEYHVFPLHPILNCTNIFSLPNKGKFSSFDRHVPSFMSGSQSEWERVAHALIDHPEKTDLLALHDMHIRDPNSYIYENSVVLFRDVSHLPSNLCKITKNKRAVRISTEDFIQSSQKVQPYVDVIRSFLSHWRLKCVKTKPII